MATRNDQLTNKDGTPNLSTEPIVELGKAEGIAVSQAIAEQDKAKNAVKGGDWTPEAVAYLVRTTKALEASLASFEAAVADAPKGNGTSAKK